MTEAQLNKWDRLAAEIQGYYPSIFNGQWLNEKQEIVINQSGWHPTRNISQAFELLKAVDNYSIRYDFSYSCQISIDSINGSYEKICEFGETAAIAITKAVLRSKGVEL